MTTSPPRRLLSLASLLVLGAGCAVAGDDDVPARLEVLGSSSSALGAAAVTAIAGTYGPGCDGRSVDGTDPWTVTVAGTPGPDELRVRRNDASCVLTLRALTADGAVYGAAPALALDTTYARDGGSAAFAGDDGSVAFLGNAKISTRSFAGDFTISLLLSDAPRASDAGPKLAVRGAPDLLTTATYAVLAGSAATNSGTDTIVDGDLGVSPGIAVTGLPAGQPTGATRLGEDEAAIRAQADLVTVHADLAGRECPPENTLTGQDLAGLVLAPGVYCFAAAAALGPGTLTLDAHDDPGAYWVFQVGSALNVAASTVSVINGGTPCNVFWEVGSSATLLEDAAFAGNIVALTSITLNTNATLSPGRALAREGAVTMSTAHLSKAACP
ncbi:MAG: hypothetical protein JWP97_6094 [Labilithrix sp.]|nr:hypothetical protein [Labilithrix sp.]